MRYVAPVFILYALVMVCFTDPEGFQVWIDRLQVVSVSRPVDCVPAAHAKVSTGNGSFVCIRETVEQAIRKLDGDAR